MDHEMIERCAKALWDKHQSNKFIQWGMSTQLLFGTDFIGKAVPWEYINNKELVIESVAQEWRDNAIIVIKALREPTDKMKIAGSIDPGSGGPDEGYETEIWQAMLDAILGDE